MARERAQSSGSASDAPTAACSAGALPPPGEAGGRAQGPALQAGNQGLGNQPPAGDYLADLPGASVDPTPDDGIADLAGSLTGERLVVLPFYHELRNALVRPERVKLQTDYFWQKWVPLLGPVRTLIVMRMRQFGYYNRQTGELRDEVARTYGEIAQSIGVSTRSLERYFESEPDPGGGPFRVLKDPLLARFIRLRHQYVWRPGKSAPERTTNEYKIAMDEPLTPDDEAALRLAAARRLRHGPGDEREGRLGRAAARKPHTRQIGGYEGEGEEGEPTRRPSGQHSRQTVGYAGPPERQSGAAIGADAMAAQPVVPLDPSQRRLEIRDSPIVNGAADGATDLEGVIATFAAANSREASPLERQLLAALVEEVDPWARSAGGTGTRWVAAAVVEAVESGSRYVAPRRIREICRRWAREGAQRPGGESARGGSATAPGGDRFRGGAARPPGPPVGGVLVASATYGREPSPDRSSEEATLPRAADDLERGTDPALDGEAPAAALAIPTFFVDEALGLNNRQLWAAVLEELRRSVPAGTFATWLKPTRLIGLAAPAGALVVGVPNSFAKEWLEERFTAPAEAALEVVLGHRRAVRFEVEREWRARQIGVDTSLGSRLHSARPEGADSR